MKPVAFIIQKLQEQTTDVVKSNKIESPLTDMKFILESIENDISIIYQ